MHQHGGFSCWYTEKTREVTMAPASSLYSCRRHRLRVDYVLFDLPHLWGAMNSQTCDSPWFYYHMVETGGVIERGFIWKKHLSNF